MYYINFTSENWSNGAPYARKTPKGGRNVGDLGEYAVAEAWNATWLHDRNTPGYDVLKDGKRYEVKTNLGNQAAFGQKFVAECQTVIEALRTYVRECEKASPIPFAGFIVCETRERAMVMTVDEFIEYARVRLVYKQCSGKKGLAWKLQKNEYTDNMRARLMEEGRL